MIDTVSTYQAEAAVTECRQGWAGRALLTLICGAARLTRP